MTSSALRRWLWVWGPAVAQMAVIFAFSAQSHPDIPSGVTDHQGHSLGYFILGALLARALAGATWRGFGVRVFLLAAILGTLYGMSDEFHQSFVPGRTPAWDDVMADAIGSVIGGGAAAIAARVMVARSGKSRAV